VTGSAVDPASDPAVSELRPPADVCVQTCAYNPTDCTLAGAVLPPGFTGA
jgi:hypothetical protein